MSGTFSVKQLRYTFTLVNNAKFANGANQLQITGLRSKLDISFPGPPTFPWAKARIWGMTQSDMRALTALTQGVLSYNLNQVLVEANSGAGWNAVFAGDLVTTVPDYTTAPATALDFYAQTYNYGLLAPVSPTSFKPGASFEQVMQTIVTKMGYTLVNNGVTGVFTGAVYFSGTAGDQLRTATKKAGIAWYGNKPGVVEIGVLNAPRSIPVAQLTPSSGLVGYPTLESINLIRGVAVFNAGLQYGGQLQISGSDQIYANGNWMVYDISHSLSEQLPGGPWFSNFTAQPLTGIVGAPS